MVSFDVIGEHDFSEYLIVIPRAWRRTIHCRGVFRDSKKLPSRLRSPLDARSPAMSGSVAEKVKFWNSLESQSDDNHFAAWNKTVPKPTKPEANSLVETAEPLHDIESSPVSEPITRSSAEQNVGDNITDSDLNYTATSNGVNEEWNVEKDVIQDPVAKDEEIRTSNSANDGTPDTRDSNGRDSKEPWEDSQALPDSTSKESEAPDVLRNEDAVVKNESGQAGGKSAHPKQCKEINYATRREEIDQGEKSNSESRNVVQSVLTPFKASQESIEKISKSKSGDKIPEPEQNPLLNNAQSSVGEIQDDHASTGGSHEEDNTSFPYSCSEKDWTGREGDDPSACTREYSTSSTCDDEKSGLSDSEKIASIDSSPSKETSSTCERNDDLRIKEEESKVRDYSGNADTDDVRLTSITEVRRYDETEATERHVSPPTEAQNPTNELHMNETHVFSDEPAADIERYGTVQKKFWQLFGVSFVLALVVSWLLARHNIEIWSMVRWRLSVTAADDYG